MSTVDPRLSKTTQLLGDKISLHMCGLTVYPMCLMSLYMAFISELMFP